MADEYGYGRNPKTGRLNWRFRTFGNSPLNMLIEKGRDKIGLRSLYNVGGKGGRDDPNSPRNIKRVNLQNRIRRSVQLKEQRKVTEINKKIQVLEQKKSLLTEQKSRVRQEKAAGKLGTKLRNLITNLKGRPRGR